MQQQQLEQKQVMARGAGINTCTWVRIRTRRVRGLLITLAERRRLLLSHTSHSNLSTHHHPSPPTGTHYRPSILLYNQRCLEASLFMALLSKGSTEQMQNLQCLLEDIKLQNLGPWISTAKNAGTCAKFWCVQRWQFKHNKNYACHKSNWWDLHFAPIPTSLWPKSLCHQLEEWRGGGAAMWM